LAVAALRHIDLDPCALQRVAEVSRKPFNGRHLPACGSRNRSHTRAHRLTIDMNGACPTLRHAASVLGAGQAQIVAEHPKERGRRVNINHHTFRVYAQGRSEEHTSELQSRSDLVCRLLLEKKK